MGVKFKSSLVENTEYCIVCGNPYPQMHHVFFNAKKHVSEKYLYLLPLCLMHHTGSKDCPHLNRKIDLKYKQMAQHHFESTIGTRNDFIREFNKSYIDE